MSLRAVDYWSEFANEKFFGIKAPKFCEGKEKPYTVSNGIPMPDYWVVLKDFSYNTKQDRYVCSTSGIQTQDMVSNTELKKGDLLFRNFRYENAVQNMVANGVITEASKNKSTQRNEKELQEGDVELKIRRILVAPLLFLEIMGLSENQAKIIYFSLIGVGGYFAYKKFKK